MCKFYEDFDRNPVYLDIARSSLLFTLKHCCAWKDTKTVKNDDRVSAFYSDDCANDPLQLKHCYTIVGRDGTRVAGRTEIDKVGYAMCFLAEGLFKYATLCKEHKAGEAVAEKGNDILKLSIEMIKQFHAMTNDPNRNAPESHLLNQPYVKGTRTLGHSMIPLRFCTQVLRAFPNSSTSDGIYLDNVDKLYLSNLADTCVDNILDKHYDPKWDLVREEMHYDWTPMNNGSPVLFYLGHAIESFWMVMDEALRRNDEELLHKASMYLKRHCECCYDELTGGLIRGISIGDDHNDKYMKDKVAWVQQEALVGTLMAWKYCKDKEIVVWAARYFNRLYSWAYKYFPLKNYGDGKFSLWMVGSDRRVGFKETYSYGDAGLKSRKENYHHPRMLMMFMSLCKG